MKRFAALAIVTAGMLVPRLVAQQTPSDTYCNPAIPSYLYNNHFYICVDGGPVKVDGGGGAISGQTPTCLPKAATSSTLTGPSAVCDSGTSVTSSEAINFPTSIASAQPLLDIRHPSFCGGAVIDDATDIGCAVQAAVTSLPSTGGEILFPCSPTDCYWANPTTMNWGAHTGPITIFVQGRLRTGTTLELASRVTTVHLIGKSGAGFTSFQSPGESAQIWARPINNVPAVGALGTTLTPTYTGTGTPTASVPAACSTSINGATYNDTTGVLATLWTCAATTGSIAAGTNQLTVAAVGGFVPGDRINVAGAGVSSGTLTAFIYSIDFVNGIFTLATAAPTSPFVAMNAGTTVSGAAVSLNSSYIQATPQHGWKPGGVFTVTPFSMNGLFPGTAINLGGATTCTPTSGGTVTRTGNVASASFSGACHIPGGVAAIVAGCSDSTYNGSLAGTQFEVIASDYVANTLSWNNTGTSGSTTGCTVTGLFEDTIETVSIFATTATTASATFYQLHQSTDNFGMVALQLGGAVGDISRVVRDIQVTSDGLGIWMQQDYLTRLQNVGASGSQCAASPNYVSFPIEIEYSSFITMNGVSFVAGCIPWGMHMTQGFFTGYAGSGPVTIQNGFVMSGVKLDHGATGVHMEHIVIEQADRGAVQVDPAFHWVGSIPQTLDLNDVGNQDNPAGNKTCLFYYLTPALGLNGSTIGAATATTKQSGADCTVNDYFTGTVSQDTPAGLTTTSYGLGQAHGVVGTINTGIAYRGEFSGAADGLGPSVVPMASLNVTTNPANWTLNGGLGGCTINTGVTGPDGNSTAGSFSGCTSAASSIVGTFTFTPAVGYCWLYGGWVYTPTLGQKAQAGGAAFVVDNAGGSHYTFTTGNGDDTTNRFDPGITNDWWHVVVGEACVGATDGTSSSIRLILEADQNKTMEYFVPFIIPVPASANVSLAELNRWRANLLHGAVPSNYNGPGIPATADPIATAGYYLLNPSGGAPNLVIPAALTGYSTDGGAGTGDTMVVASGRFTQNTNPVCPNGTNGELTTSGCAGSYTLPQATTTVLGGVKCDGTTINCGAGGVINVIASQTPAWLTYLGAGTDGSNTNASGVLAGEKWYTNFTVPFGNTVTTNSPSLVIHATGTCTIAGTINLLSNGNETGACGAPGGGSGGGTAAGTAGQTAPEGWLSAGIAGIGNNGAIGGGTAGTLTGGNGANGSTVSSSPSYAKSCAASGVGQDGHEMSGGTGRAGGSSGGALGHGAVGLVLICNQITGTDGTHVGVIFSGGGNGVPAAAINTGAGSGGGGGPVLLSSLQTVTSWPTILPSAGPGALNNGVAVPEALLVQDSCVSPAKVSLTVTTGALSACTVQQAGTNCGGFGTFTQLGTGGGSGGTITPTWVTETPTGTFSSGALTMTVSSATGIVVGMAVTGTGIPPNAYVAAISGTTVTLNNYTTASGSGASLTFTGGALQSCTATGGSGYQANVTYTTSGNGGDGGSGWWYEFAAGVLVNSWIH